MKAEGADILMNQDAGLGVYSMAWGCRTNKMSLCINLKVDQLQEINIKEKRVKNILYRREDTNLVDYYTLLIVVH